MAKPDTTYGFFSSISVEHIELSPRADARVHLIELRAKKIRERLRRLAQKHARQSGREDV
jgi:hypothetical protein